MNLVSVFSILFNRILFSFYKTKMNFNFFTCLILLSIISIECSKNNTKVNSRKSSSFKSQKFSQPIYFKKEPQNQYVIESSFTSAQARSNSLFLDCFAESANWNGNNRAKKKHTIKWFKDNIDVEYAHYSNGLDDDVKKEIFSNGTLKLTYNTFNNKLPYLSSPVDLLSTYRCVVGDTFGKITSRPSKIFRISPNASAEAKFLRKR